jgi:hypothetical protein
MVKPRNAFNNAAVPDPTKKLSPSVALLSNNAKGMIAMKLITKTDIVFCSMLQVRYSQKQPTELC